MNTQELYDYLMNEWHKQDKGLTNAILENRSEDAKIIIARMGVLTELACKISPVNVSVA